MELISNVSNDQSQECTVIMQDGRKFSMSLEFKKQQLGWFLSITFNNFTINNIRLVTSGNILYQWREVMQFGLVVVTEGNQEPMFIDDLVSGRCKLYCLNRQETLDYARMISGEITT